MNLPSKIIFLVVSQGGLHIGFVEYWFRNDVWECVAVAKKLQFLRDLSFAAADQECLKRKLKFEWKPSTRKFSREARYPASPEFNFLFQ